MEPETEKAEIIFTENTIVVRIITKEAIDWSGDPVEYTMHVINQVPVIFFEFTDPKHNFFIHLNFSKVIEADCNFQSYHIPIILTNSLYIKPEKSINEKYMKLSQKDSLKLVACCIHQAGLSYEYIEASIDFIYDHDQLDYEWIRNA